MDEKRKIRWGLLFGCVVYLTGVVWLGVWLVNHTIRLVPIGQHFNSAMVYLDNMDGFQFILILTVLLLAIRVLELEMKMRGILSVVKIRRRY